jgi:hypothetical protein
LTQTHPFAVRRVKELTTWVSSGAYDPIVSGSYVRRGEEPPVSAEFDSAVQHYRERFTAMIERTIGGVNKLAGQIQSWLRSDRAEGDRPPEDADGPEDHPGDAPSS